MWQLVKSELKYNWKELLALGLFLLFYTKISLFNNIVSEDIANNLVNISSWLFYAFYYVIFIKPMSQKRVRQFAFLPLPNKKLAATRFIFSTIPFIIPIMIYFGLIQLVIFESKQIEVTDIIFRLCDMFALTASLIILRDCWFFSWNFEGKLGTILITGFGLLIVLIVNRFSINRFMIEYANIQYFLVGLVIMLTTIYSYQKRKSYLS